MLDHLLSSTGPRALSEQQPRARTPRRAWGRWLLLAIAVLYVVVPNARPDFGHYNAHDSESYLSLAYGVVNGLGYTRSMIPGQYVAHTVWAPGLPALIAPAVALSGSPVDWRLLKWSMAAIGLVGLMAASFLAVRITGFRSAAAAVILTLGLNPFYWYFSHRVMIEVPLTVAVLVAALLIDLVWAKRAPQFWQVAAVGLVAGASMLIRGHAIGLLVAPLAYLMGGRRAVGSWRRLGTLAGIYALAFVLPYGAWTARCAVTPAAGFDGMSQLKLLVKQNPNDPSSPVLPAAELMSQTLYNLRTHIPYNIAQQVVPGTWNESWWGWKGSGYVALALTSIVIILAFWSRHTLSALHPAGAGILLINCVYAFGGSPRFWAPFSFVVTVLLTIRLWPLVRSCGRGVVTIAAAALVLNLALYIAQHERLPYNTHGPWAEYAAFLEELRDRPVKSQGVLAPNPNAFQLSTGIPSPLAVPGNDPTVDHIVLRSDRYFGRQLPSNAHLVRSLGPWQLWALPQPVRVSHLGVRVFGAGD